jgi:hypothetical protein
LDPVVANKGVFTSNDKRLLEYIDAGKFPKGKPIIFIVYHFQLTISLTSLSGEEDWVFEYAEVVERENARFNDGRKDEAGMAGKACISSRGFRGKDTSLDQE